MCQMIWVRAEGFFYVLSFKPVAVSQKSFVTPIWMLQATWAGFLNNVSDDVAQAMQALRWFFHIFFFRAKAWHLLKISSLFTTKLCIIIYVYTSSNNNIYMHNKYYILHIQYIQYIILNTYQYYIYIFIYLLFTHIHIYTYTYIYISTYICIHIDIYIYIYIYTCIHIYIYIYIHMYTCIYTYT